MDLNNSARGEAFLAKSINGLLGVEERREACCLLFAQPCDSWEETS